jgi:nucleoside-diphosphate-sugar epimerase
LTGATGFVGSHVAEALSRAGIRVRALIRKTSDARRIREFGVECIECALTDQTGLARAVEGTAAVIHLAGLTRARTDEEYHRTNVAATEALVRAVVGAEDRPHRFVFLSSLAAVGPSYGGRPVRPEDEPRPLTAYGRSKQAGEAACLGVAADVEVVVLRAPAVYGPRDRDLYQFFRLAARGFLPMPTGPARPLQLVHVEDLADAVLRAATVPGATGIMHIAEDRAHAWEEIARMVARAVGRRARIVKIPAALISRVAAWSEWWAGITGAATIFNRDKARELLAPGWLCETEHARMQLGFVARVPLAEGLERTAIWYRNEGWL